MSWDGPRRVLVGVDDSDTARRAFAHAVGLARRHDAELLVLHVRPRPLPRLPSGADVDAWVADEEHYLVELRRVVELATAELQVRCRLAVTEGDPLTLIAAFAGDQEVDAVVVGASMRLSHRFVGSLAARLVRVARWPVTVVP